MPAVLLCVFAAVFPVLKGWTDPPVIEMYRARTALTWARTADAARLAPLALSAAESTLAVATAEYVRQEARLVSFRNFGRAAAGFAEAESLFAFARTAAEDSARAENGNAQAMLAEARSAVRQAEDCSVALRREGRGNYRRAKMLLAESEVLLANGRPLDARERAAEAVEESAEACRHAAASVWRFVDHESVGTWKRWIDETLADSRTRGTSAVIVVKEKNEVRLYQSGKLVKRYEADMGLNRLQNKLRAGDRATPEGKYRITKKKGPGNSRYFMALLLDYPNETDRQRMKRAKDRGQLPRNASLGGDIELHGEGGRGDDWTRGCVALSNADIRDLFNRVAVGTPVTIVGGDGNGGAYSTLARKLADLNKEQLRR